MPDLNTRISAATEKLLQLERQKTIKEYAAKEKERKAQRLAAAASRQADAHRKIELGGLVIAAEVDDWNPAEIVGALLTISQRLAGPDTDALRASLREKGIAHMDARAANRSRK